MRTRRLGFPDSAELPRYLTPLVGRTDDVAQVKRLLRTHRLVSLVGAGGSGKTRLAVAVAAAPRRGRTADVAWIDLAALVEPARVAEHVAALLGVREHPGRPVAASLVERLCGSHALLVLDNCEHLVAAAGELAATLLRGCPALRVLTTSRQALGVAGEVAWPVPPLALPPSDDCAADSPAVQLFVQRASDVLPGFALNDANRAAVAHICRRLDGLPLAIELAAARVRLLPPAQLAGRLDSMLSLLATRSEQRLPRHRTLRALIGWSYELLSAAERRLLGRLSVFTGGFTLEAAERVASDGALPAPDVLELLASLVDRSLVTAREWHGEARFGLLETVRQYAWQTVLDAGEDDALRARHAAYCVTLAEAAEPHVLGGARGTPWMNRLEHEHGNLRAALEWCAAADERAPLALRLGAALLWFDFARGHLREPRHALEGALARARDVPPHVRARALTALGYMALWTGDAAAVQPALRAGVELLRGGGSCTDLAFALIGLATATGFAGDRAAAAHLFDEAEAALGNPRTFPRDDFPRALLFAFGRYWRGSVAMAHGDLALARASYETAVAVGRDWGSHPTIAHPLTALGRVLALQGELDAAQTCLHESLSRHLASDDRWGLIQALEAATLLLERRARPQDAARLLGAAERLRGETGIAAAPPEQAQLEALRAALRAALGEPVLHAELEHGARLPLERLARVATGGGSAGRAPEREAQTSPAGTAADHADLTVRALGRLAVFVDGRPLGGEAFGSSRPRELLLLLLWHPEGRTREQIGLEFWPDASAAQVKNAFHVTLHRLRRALGRPEWVVLEGDRYRLDPTLHIEFDAGRFRDTMSRALRAGTLDEEVIVHALGLYRGEFLDGEIAGDWHLAPRDQLRQLYRHGLRALGERRLADERFDQAADAFRALLAVDPLDEAACRALMTCHARAGLRVDAIRLYESMAQLLEEQLGAAPAAETTALYRRLRAVETSL